MNKNNVINDSPDVSDADYVPQDYPRSNVVYVHEPLDAFLRQRDLKPPLGDDFLLLNNAIVAGGYVADLLGNTGRANDIDLFFLSERHLRVTVDKLLLAGYKPALCDSNLIDSSGYKQWLKPSSPELDERAFLQFEQPSDGRLRSSHQVQCIKIRYFDSAEHVLDVFDYTCIQFALDFGKGAVVYNPAGAIDLAARRLVQHRMESHHRVLKRLEKYQNKGFTPVSGFIIPPER